MATLYRKYRPQTFKEVFGQNHIKITLEHELSANKLAHAYLFCGPRGIGKTTIARVLAKAVNCEQRKDRESEPCNKCAHCTDITIGKSLDIIEVDAASHTGVDNVRENIISASRVSPTNSKYKVFIIDEVHMLSISAFNALLKVLEEPPENVIFILATTEVHKIPMTIISRCERFDFKRINVTEIVKLLTYITGKEDIKIDKPILESIARHSEGHMRDAISLLGQVIAIGGKEISQEEADLVIPRSDLAEAINLTGLLAKKDAAAAISLINNLIGEGVDLKRFISDAIEIFRKVMLLRISPGLADKLGLEMGEQMEIKLSEAAKTLELGRVVAFIEIFSEAKLKMKSSFITQLPIEIAIARLCSTSTAAQTQAKATSAPAVPPRTPGPAPSQAPGQNSPNTAANTNEPNTTEPISINKEIITSKWNEVLAKIKTHNHSLSFILRVCEPKDINGSQLCLAFKYKFHKERINDANIKQIIEKVLNEVYGQPISIEAVVDESLEVSNGNVNGNMGGAGIAADEPATAKTEEEKPSDAKAMEAIKPSNASSGAKALEDKKAIEGKEEGSNMIDNLLKNFGGKIIE